MKSTMYAHKVGKAALGIFSALAMGGSGMTAHAQDSADDSLGIPGEFSANVALTTDYRFRGISQSSTNPAVQGGLDYSVGVAEGFGIYLGTWASSVDFGDGDEASMELDFYGGVTAEIGMFGFDLGVIYYAYPGADSSLDYDYIEFAASVSVSPIESVTFGVGYAFSPDYFASSGDFHYPNASVEFTPDLGLPLPVTLGATVGYSFIDDEAAFGAKDYLDWSVGISTQYKILTLSFYYVDNDLSGTLGDEAFVFTVGASF